METLGLCYAGIFVFCSLDCISVAIQEEHEVLTVGSELQLEVLLLVVEEERLHHLEY